MDKTWCLETLGYTGDVDRVFNDYFKGKGVYYLRVRAFNRVDGNNYYSAWSNVVSAEYNT